MRYLGPDFLVDVLTGKEEARRKMLEIENENDRIHVKIDNMRNATFKMLMKPGFTYPKVRSCRAPFSQSSSMSGISS